MSNETAGLAAALPAGEHPQRAKTEAEHDRDHGDVAALLERLGVIGRRLTAEHDPQRVLQAIVRDAIELLPCDRVAVFRLNEPDRRLDMTVGHEDGRPLAPFSIGLDDAHSGTALAVRQRHDVRVESDGGSAPLPGRRQQSRLYAPLIVGDRVIGAMMVQAERPHVYRQRELLITRELAAYGAVALSNADDTSRLVQAQHAKSMFLANLSHELRTPLNGILGFAQLLRRDFTLDQRQRGRVDAIHRSGAHLLALINDILDMTRLEAARCELQAQDVDVGEMLELVSDIVRVKADEKKLHFRCNAAPGLPRRVRADGTRLRQVLINLLDNALKFTDDGEVSLRVAPVATNASGQNHGPSARLRFEVADSGVGIPCDQLNAIFEPFEQVGEARRKCAGAGLGLAISRELVRLMGGDIAVRSKPGRGSSFSFEIELPVVPAACPAGGALGHTPEPQPSSQPAAWGVTPQVELQVVVGYEGPRRKVLVVDDTPSARALFVGYLSSVGFEVIEAANGAESLRLAHACKPDLILMDRTMPVMGGTEALLRLRQNEDFAGVPIISVSACVTADHMVDPDTRADAFIGKPVNLMQLTDMIGSLLKLTWVRDTVRLLGH